MHIFEKKNTHLPYRSGTTRRTILHDKYVFKADPESKELGADEFSVCLIVRRVVSPNVTLAEIAEEAEIVDPEVVDALSKLIKRHHWLP